MLKYDNLNKINKIRRLFQVVKMTDRIKQKLLLCADTPEFNKHSVPCKRLMKVKHSLLSILFVVGFLTHSFATFSGGANLETPFSVEYTTTETDTIPPLQDRQGDFINDPNSNPFDLDDPSVIDKNVEYDPETGNYIITERIGEDYFRSPSYMTFDEYLDYRAKEQERQYFQELSGVSSSSGGGRRDPIEQFDIKNSLIDRLFGGSTVDIRPQGNIDLTFGVDFQRVQNPILTIRQQRQGGFDFDMNIQMNVTGKIGEKLNLSTNYNTQATFDFENQMKLQYDSEAFSEDDIIKTIEAGNVSFPLRSSLIQGSQSLFGLRIDTQWGRLRLSTVASQQKSRREQLQIQGGAQLQEYEVTADEYDENRHFFLSHYNRETFEGALQNLPQINSLFKINPNEIQVWVTNDRNETEDVRDILAIADLGEPIRDKMTNSNPDSWAPANPRFRDIFGSRALPDNDANDIYQTLLNTGGVRTIDGAVATLTGPRFGFQQSRDFEKVSARKLRSSEFTYHPELGFISVNVNLRPDQVLAVAYQYDYNGRTYKVGEFANDSYEPDSLGVLFVKMLKSTTPRIDLPTWDLMMKNVYSIGAFQVSQEDFKLDIFYEDPGGGQKRFLPNTNLSGQPLLRIFNLDNLNVQGDPQPDGIFDFVPGLTINTRSGKVMFPVLEPFGSSLARQIDDPNLAAQYSYQMLYDSTITRAREYPEFNRFTIKGSYKSSVSSEISLGAFNLPRGSVRVRAGGQELQEGIDYEVDYNIGRVKILNDAILNSGLPVNVSFEDNTLFGFQTKTLLGVRADYEVNKDFSIGATYLHLFERPFTQKVNIGDDPINNRIYGLDVNLSKDAPWLTRIVDGIPLIQTKEPSSISFQAEAAYLQPGHSRAVNQGRTDDGKVDKSGVVYLDDFEGSTSSFDLRTPAASWVLASVPQNDHQNNNPLFPESQFIDTTLSGVNRAKLNWYRIDLSVVNSQSNPYTAAIPQDEVFPNVTVRPGFANNIQSLDLTYYPDERGPYNFDRPFEAGATDFSAGVLENGRLAQPQTRWGGIMRSLNTNDFEAANIEYIEFWLLNPFINGPNDGDLYINLGNVSEDILRDSRKFFENGLPTDGTTRTDTTSWSRVPRSQSVINAFENDESKRILQDVGLDGFDDDGEGFAFRDILGEYQMYLDPAAYAAIEADPANDNFRYFRDYDDATPVLERYRLFNNPQGNSQSPDPGSRTVQSATNLPDSEDINRDNTLNETEAYFQYKIPLRAVDSPNSTYELDYENEFITDSIHGGTNGERIWYRFKIPLDQYSSQVGGIQDFRSIRFIRMYLHGFSQQVTLRFARLELARNQWRRYKRYLQVGLPEDGSIQGGTRDPETIFDVNAVNIEENSTRTPFGYVLPPGIEREQSNQTAFPDILQNEQSLSMEICNLKPERARGIYKNLNLDMRIYKRLRMFVHGESFENLDRSDLAVFIRLGSDFENNYYEYEIPLTPSINTALPYGGEDYQLEVWKPENSLDIPLEIFKTLKQERNNSGHPLNKTFDFEDPENNERMFRVKGNPNLGYVKGVMIGVVNRDEVDHCAEVWVNELRLSGFDEEGGVAAIARLDMQLADFGGATISTNYLGRNFGGLEDKIAQRSREEVIQYDLATNLELGKFLPEKSGVKIPFYAQYSKSISNPEFDPYDLDIPLDEKLSNADPADRDSIKSQAQDVTEIKSFNFTNVRKVRTNSDKKPMPWNIENFSFTYAFTETEKRDPIIASDKLTTHNGAVNYTYSRGSNYIQPFKKLFKKDKYLKLITDFNFNPLPNSYGFSTVMNRQLQETRYRFAGDDPFFTSFYNKQFAWDRNYNLQWDLSRTLKFNFNATNRAVIDELDEFVNDEADPRYGQRRTADEKKEYIWDRIKNLGRTKSYAHNFNVNYTLPFKSIPFMDWVQVRAQYGADYRWDAAALNVDSLGNVVQNSQTRQINGDLNFENLYKKSKYLDKISKPRRGKKSSKDKRSRSRSDQSDGGRDAGPGKKSGKSRGARGEKKGGKDGVKDSSNTKDGKQGGDDASLAGADEISKTGKTRGKRKIGGSKSGKEGDLKGRGKDGKKTKRKRDREPTVAERMLIRPLLLLRKARLTYAENFATVVPGYTPGTKYLGHADGFGSPGWDFVAGLQPDIAKNDNENDWLNRAAADGWITDNVFLNQQILQNYSQDINGKITLEPFPDFRIELNADRRFSENTSLYFRDTTFFDDPSVQPFEEIVHSIPRDVGSFSISYFSMQTLFDKDIDALFARFENNREEISDRLGTGLHDEDQGYTEGYGRTQQDVLLPAFLAAYTNQAPGAMKISDNYAEDVLFKTRPKINWQLTYNGLSRIPMFKDIFASFNLSHGYNSTLTVNSFNTDQDFEENNPQLKNINSNFYSRFEVPNVVISEQFSPLLGIDVKLKNDMSFRVDFKKARNLRMSFLDYRLAETKTSEYAIGFGYKLKNVVIGFLSGGNKKKSSRSRKNSKKGKNDPNDPQGSKKQKGNNMNIEFDFSVRDDVTVNHLLDQEVSEETRGLKTIRISPSVDYDINDRLNIRFFFDRSQTIPATSASFPITNTQAGITIRFSLN